MQVVMLPVIKALFLVVILYSSKVLYHIRPIADAVAIYYQCIIVREAAKKEVGGDKGLATKKFFLEALKKNFPGSKLL